ncbi:hypothetical protein [Rheinheimera baltica]|uniref:hypothetical protein n=1 Tax=Rheinheimera baltica TaxID=67576 RepID=UPI0004895ED0|nr:hypothetical protein [Rheinheimera baltica]
MKIYLSVAALLLSTSVFANVTVQGEIERIFPNLGVVNFKLKNDRCGNTGQYYYFPLTNEREKAWYSMILAAANTGKRVVVSVPQCPTNAYVQVRYIYQEF